MDLDASLKSICTRDGRFRVEAYHFVLDSLDHTIALRAAPPAPAGETGAAPAAPPAARTGPPGPSNVTGRDLLNGFRELALDRFGALAREVLRTWGLTRTDDVGAIVFNMVEAGLLQRTATDSAADYHEVFDFEFAFDRGFEDRLRREKVGLSDRTAGSAG